MWNTNFKLPNYLAQAFSDLYEEDGLVVLGRGLGLLHLIASFCRFYVDMEEGHMALLMEEIDVQVEKMNTGICNATLHKNDPYSDYLMRLQTRIRSHRPLIFVIGLRDSERSCLISILERWGTPAEMVPTEITNENGSADKRAALYDRGGVFLITSRILIVDLLTDHAKPDRIDGILVGHAEQVSEKSTEAFILRIFRTQKRFSNNSPIFTDTSKNPSSELMKSFQDGFIKAFSDAPDSLMAGFAKVDKVLKALFVQRLYIYPRFHEEVVQELEKSPPIVEQLRQTLTPKMSLCQAAIAAAVKACIREIKKNVTFIDWNDVNVDNKLNSTSSTKNNTNRDSNNAANDLTFENCVTTKFDIKIIQQLEQDWHRLKPATKRLIDDLRSLRRLFHYLLELDCISFWKTINNLKRVGASSRFPSLWLLSESANVLFKTAKERMYTIQEGNKPTKKNPNPVKILIPHLEENPKWTLLHQILTEIETSYRKNKKTKVNNDIDNGGGNKVLVMVKDVSTLHIVRDYLLEGREKFMKRRFLNKYLVSVNDTTRALSKCSAKSGTSNHTISEESRLLMEEESKIRYFLKQHGKEDASMANCANTGKRKDASSSLNTIPDWKRKRRKIQEEMSRGNQLMRSAEDRERIVLMNEAFEEAEHYDVKEISSSVMNDVVFNNNSSSSNNGTLERNGNKRQSDHSQILLNEDDLFKSEEMNDLRVVVQTYTSTEGEEAYLLLNDVQPNHIILYDTEPSFIRSIEVHSAQRYYTDDDSEVVADGEDKVRGRISVRDRMKVYFMLYDASSEEKNFVRALDREQNAFQLLIQHKKTMALPVNMLGPWTTQEMQLATVGTINIGGAIGSGSYMSGTLPLSIDTRTGRGKKVSLEKRDVAVDIREFRSSLPSILHKGGMRIAPVTLTVGDYVLSNVHCVERKSLNDLFGSLGVNKKVLTKEDDARLGKQAETMSKYYKVPCLLIEFDPTARNQSFCVQNVNEIGPEVRQDSVCGRMSLLLMHVPKLRLLWSRSPHETLKIFKLLKSNHEEVDVEKAKAIGTNESIDANIANNDNGINDEGRDMLLRLPGITEDNARKVMNECDSIAELACLTREEMKRILGPLAGQKLFTFFHQSGDLQK